MKTTSEWGKVKNGAIAAFMERCGGRVNGVPVELYENPTEEILDEAQRKGRVPKLFLAGGEQRSPKRLEENYLYATRRFPAAVDNVIGAGALIAGDFRFFQNAIGQQGGGDGFPAAFVLSSNETNMDVGGQIAQGKNFALRGIGISFNTEALSANIQQVLDAHALEFSKQGDQYRLRHGPTRLWPGGAGVAGFATNSGIAAPGATIVSASNGLPDPRALRWLRVPRMIREKESFSYLFVSPLAVRSSNGVAWALTEFVTCTEHLWGGQLDVIPG